jgi:chitinase
LTCTTADANIYYTTDGNDPTIESAQYDDANKPVLTSSCTFKAFAVTDGYADSNVAAAEFTITVLPTVETPTIDPDGGTFDNATTITLSCATKGAMIRYTLDGSDPISISARYSGPIIVNSSCTVKARAFKGSCTDSEIASETFTRR